jgi:hypothetical protein
MPWPRAFFHAAKGRVLECGGYDAALQAAVIDRRWAWPCFEEDACPESLLE